MDASEKGECEGEMLRLLLGGEQKIAAGLGHDLDEVLAEADVIRAMARTD